MTLIQDSLFSGIDFESAGAAPGDTDAPIQIGIASWSLKSSYIQPLSSYLHCDKPIRWSAQKVHGITPQHLLNAPPLASLWPTLKPYFQSSIPVAHAAGTEKKFLRAFPNHPWRQWIDTLLLARSAWPTLESHALGFICDHFSLTESIQALVPNKSWHDALFDAIAALRFLEYFIETHQIQHQHVDILIRPDISAWKAHTKRKKHR